MFEAWLKLNATDVNARAYLYQEIPFRYTFNETLKKWTPRQKHMRIIPRLFNISPRDSELFHLRLLLLHVRGPKSYSDIRTVHGVVYPTFKDAAMAKNLLLDDSEWENCLRDASFYKMPKQIRKLFATLLSYCQVTDPMRLWDKFKSSMIEDFLRRGNDIDTAIIKALRQISNALQYNSCQYNNFNLPILPELNDVSYDEHEENSMNNEIREELEQNKALFNNDQRDIFDHIIRAVLSDNETERLFYLDGPGARYR